MTNHVLHAYGLNLMVAEMLVKDLSPEQMCAQPHGLINHPAWSLGHLVNSGHACCGLIGVESSLPDGWAESYGMGGKPDPDQAANPSKDELLERHRAFHARISEALPDVDAAVLAQRHPKEPVRAYFPTVGDQIVFMLTAHEMDHLGQMAAWRRAMGLAPAM
jgi:hypothetical protein